jgi:hypothetical protein
VNGLACEREGAVEEKCRIGRVHEACRGVVEGKRNGAPSYLVVARPRNPALGMLGGRSRLVQCIREDKLELSEPVATARADMAEKEGKLSGGEPQPKGEKLLESQKGRHD